MIKPWATPSQLSLETHHPHHNLLHFGEYIWSLLHSSSRWWSSSCTWTEEISISPSVVSTSTPRFSRTRHCPLLKFLQKIHKLCSCTTASSSSRRLYIDMHLHDAHSLFRNPRGNPKPAENKKKMLRWCLWGYVALWNLQCRPSWLTTSMHLHDVLITFEKIKISCPSECKQG